MSNIFGNSIVSSVGKSTSSEWTQIENKPEIYAGIGDNSIQQGTDTQAITISSSACGSSTIAGSFGYRITAYDKENRIVTLYDYQNNITNELAVGDVYTIIFINNYDLHGVIEEISVSENIAYVKISNVINDTLDPEVGIENLTSIRNVFFVPAKPDCGYIEIGRATHTEGYETRAVGLYSHAEGCYSRAYGKYSHAEGVDTTAAYAGHAEGNETKALGLTAHAEGYLSEATGKQSHAEGYNTVASGEGSHSEGIPTGDGTRVVASGRGSHAEGIGSHADGGGSHAEGGGTTADASFSHAEGQYSHASGEASHAEGYYTKAEWWFAHAEGDHSVAAHYSAHAEGQNSKATGRVSHAEGYQTQADGSSSHAEGSGSTASGSASHAEGFNTLADGEGAHAEGVPTGGGDKVTASGRGSHAEGIGSQSGGSGSHAEGGGTKAIKDFSHAEGQYSQADGVASHAEGYQTKTSAIGAHAEGNNSRSYGPHSHAEGEGTEAGINPEGFAGDVNNYRSSHAEGIRTKAQKSASHAEGIDTLAEGIAAHAEGNKTKSVGNNAHAEGLGTIASSDSQHVQGRYNIEDTSAAHIVGWGTSDNARKNIHTLSTGGNAWFAGDVRVGGDSYDAGNTIATTQYVDEGLYPIKEDVELLKDLSAGVLYDSVTVESMVNPVTVPSNALPAATIDKIGTGIKTEVINEALTNTNPSEVTGALSATCIAGGVYRLNGTFDYEPLRATFTLTTPIDTSEGETIYVSAELLSGSIVDRDGNPSRVTIGIQSPWEYWMVGEQRTIVGEGSPISEFTITMNYESVSFIDAIIAIHIGKHKQTYGVPVASVKKDDETVYTVPEQIRTLKAHAIEGYTPVDVYGLALSDTVYNYLDLANKQYVINCASGIDEHNGIAIVPYRKTIDVSAYISDEDGEITVSAGDSIRFCDNDGYILPYDVPNAITYYIKKGV